MPNNPRGRALTRPRPSRLLRPAYLRRRTIGVMATRDEAAADALGSVRLEGLDPSRVEPILKLWAQGRITDAQLHDIERRLLAGEPFDDLLPPS